MNNFENMIYVKDKNFVFTFIPKAACTNWKCILRSLAGYQDYLNVSLAHDRVKSGLTYLNTVNDADAILNDHKVAKYCFVRDPYSRVLSAYLNKIEPYVTGERDKNQGNVFFYEVYESIKSYVEEDDELIKVDFYSFLKWLSYSNSYFVNNEHWFPQNRILHLDKIKYDFIGRMESIEQDSGVLLGLMQSHVEFPKKTIAGHSTNAGDKFSKYYCTKSIALVNKIYKDDFNLLNYTMIKQ